MFGLRIKDTQGSFRAYNKSGYEAVRWTSDNYSFVSEIIYNVHSRKVKYGTTPISTIYGIDKEGGMRKRDAVRTVFNMLGWKFNKK